MKRRSVMMKTMMTSAALLVAGVLAGSGCNVPPGGSLPSGATAGPPLPFRAEDNVVPALLDPDRPAPPPPMASLSRMPKRRPTGPGAGAGAESTVVAAPSAPAPDSQ